MRSLDAQIVGLKSRAETAHAERQRQEQLAEKGYAAGAKLDEARAGSEVASNALKSAEAERQVITQQVQEGEVLAPANGRVLAIPVTAGSVVMPGEAIAKIAANAYVLRLELPERHARFIKNGDPVVIGGREMSGGDAPIGKGSITLVYPELQDGRVIADAQAEGLGKYFVGERVLVWISAGKRQTIAVPRSYLFQRFGLDYARLQEKDGKTIDTVVQLGQPARLEGAGSGFIEVLGGLRAGDRLVKP
jgi:multidrug efflux pump subunit AcrA (membrane-fusion protein)